jgi:hypothetical protein
VYDFLTDYDRRLFLHAVFNDDAEWYNANQDGNSQDYSLEAGVWYRLSIMTASPDAEPENVKIAPGSTCEVHVLAHDGCYRLEPPKQLDQENHYLTGASRVDVAIKCDDAGTYPIYIEEGWGDDTTAGAETVWDGTGWEGEQQVASLIVTDPAGAVPDTGPFLSDGSSWKNWRAPYLQDMREIDQQDVPDRDRWTTELTNNDMNNIEYNEGMYLILLKVSLYFSSVPLIFIYCSPVFFLLSLDIGIASAKSVLSW